MNLVYRIIDSIANRLIRKQSRTLCPANLGPILIANQLERPKGSFRSLNFRQVDPELLSPYYSAAVPFYLLILTLAIVFVLCTLFLARCLCAAARILAESPQISQDFRFGTGGRCPHLPQRFASFARARNAATFSALVILTSGTISNLIDPLHSTTR